MRGRKRVYERRVKAVFYLRPDQRRDLHAWSRKQKMSASETVSAVLVSGGVIKP